MTGLVLPVEHDVPRGGQLQRLPADPPARRVRGDAEGRDLPALLGHARRLLVPAHRGCGVTPLQIGLSALVLVALAIAIWGTFADRRDYEELRAVLDDLAGQHHSPAHRVAHLEDRQDDVERELIGDQPSSGRHAHTDDPPTNPIGVSR